MSRLLIIGGGNMGLAYTKAILRNKVFKKKQISVVEKLDHRRAIIHELGIENIHQEAPPATISDADLILLAVKPQEAETVFNQLVKTTHKDQVLISIMAGINLDTLKNALKLEKVVRAMPNLPLLLGQGMTVYTCKHLDKREIQMIEKVFSCTGESIFVDNENMIDAATAVSGSGPAYVFYFIQSMIDTAQRMGFTREQSSLLTMQTFKGALHLLEQSDSSCNEWIKKVSSKGGTTEKAIMSFNKNKLNQHIGEGLQAALARSIELSKHS